MRPTHIAFDPTKNTLLLSVDREAVDSSAVEESARERGLEPKRDLHITVIGFKNAREIVGVLIPMQEGARQQLQLQIRLLTENTDWSFTLEPQIYHIRKRYPSSEQRESLIQMVDMPGVKVFYEQLNTLLGVRLETPPAHITLFTGGTDKEKSKMGIGINTYDEFLAMSPQLV